MRATKGSNLFYDLRRFLVRDKACRLHGIDEYFDLRYRELMLRNIIELFLIFKEAHDLEAIILHHINVFAQCTNIARNPHIIEPSA